MQRFVCSLLPGPGEGEVEALSAFPEIKKLLGLPAPDPAAPEDSGKGRWLGSWPHWQDPAVPGKPDPCGFGGATGWGGVCVPECHGETEARHIRGGRRHPQPSVCLSFPPARGGEWGSSQCLWGGVLLVPAGR